MNVLFITAADSLVVGGSTSAVPAMKKRSREKELTKDVVHARYLMEKYGMRWRIKTLYGMLSCELFYVLACSF